MGVRGDLPSGHLHTSLSNVTRYGCSLTLHHRVTASVSSAQEQGPVSRAHVALHAHFRIASFNPPQMHNVKCQVPFCGLKSFKHV